MPGPVQFSMSNLLSTMSGNPPEEDEEDAVELPRAPVRKAVKAKPLAPKNVVQLAKARLKDVKVELRRLKALDKERAELERLITAAETKPRLVALKKTAG